MSIDSRHVDGLEFALVQAREPPEIKDQFLDPAEAEFHRRHAFPRFCHGFTNIGPVGQVGGDFGEQPFDRALMGEDERQRVVDLMSDASHQFTQRSHFGRLNELRLGILQKPVGLFELVIGLFESACESCARFRRRSLRAGPLQREVAFLQFGFDAPVFVL